MIPSLRPLLLLTLGSLATLSLSSSSSVQTPLLSSSSSPFTTTSSNLADKLTQSRRSTIFYDYLRDVGNSLDKLLVNKEGELTILVPINSAIMKMDKKPHQGSPQDRIGIMGKKIRAEEEDEAKKYLEEWVKSYLIKDRIVDLAQEPQGDGGWEGKSWESMQGRKIAFEQRGEDKIVVTPGEVEIVGMDRASNGIVYYLDGTLSVE